MALVHPSLLKKYLVLLAKITLSVGLVWYAFRNIDLSSAWTTLVSIPLPAVLGAVLLLFLQFALGAYRLRELLHQMDQRFRLTAALDAILVGAFFSQTLISFLGGDAMRIWRMIRARIPASVATKSVLLDRISGFAGVVAIVLVTIPLLVPMLQSIEMKLGLLLIAAGVLGGIFSVFVLRRLPQRVRTGRLLGGLWRFVSLGLDIMRSRRGALYVLGLSIMIQVINVVVLYILGQGLSINMDFDLYFVFMPVVLFLSMLPISIAGWGVREGAMVAALAAIDVPSHQSLALSICFGLCLIFVSLPGGLIWFASRGKVPHGEVPVEPAP
ncbi:MAG: lysylphosphatidylglycerol synthase transmembrane domain-containing protein [Burkholderiales bacterium]|nr:lysylphosphatidylglycerol synthase transmembrane domain-containing protein [Burkholderiales bacterium]